MDFAKEAFIAAVAACALIAFLSPARAQAAEPVPLHLEMAKG